MSRIAGRRRIRVWALLAWLGAAGLCACASMADRTEPIQYLDPSTGATFRVVAKPLVFARARPQVAARARDYATVAAGFIDRGGRIDYVLLVYLWSTIDPRNEQGAADSRHRLILAADDRRIALQPMEDPLQAAPPIDRPPVHHVIARIYRTDPDTLRYLTAAGHLSLLDEDVPGEARFELWDDERPLLTALLTLGP